MRTHIEGLGPRLDPNDLPMLVTYLAYPITLNRDKCPTHCNRVRVTACSGVVDTIAQSIGLTHDVDAFMDM